MGALGLTWGDPYSVKTYSGVPYHLFAELDRLDALAGRADAKDVRLLDLRRGAVDLRRSIARRRPVRDALWRYMPENIQLLTERHRRRARALPQHDASIQFGVAGVPDGPLVAHVEIPVELALSSPVFAASYGFDRVDDRRAQRAIDGEREFLSSCDIVWTNTEWTARSLATQGVARSALRICPPACGMADPGPTERDWSQLRILFVGKDWIGKGGPLLLEAFAHVRARRPDATLTIIGCSPNVAQAGVRVLGFLRKDDAREGSALEAEFRHATVYCMPSHWESVGIVYMEAALYGLPVVMLMGQGREDIFPESMAISLRDAGADSLATALLSLAEDPHRMHAMGRAGYEQVSRVHTWPHVAAIVQGYLDDARRIRSERRAEPTGGY